MSYSFQTLHHRHEDVIVVGVIRIGVVTGLAVVVVISPAGILATIIASTVVGVAMIPRPPKMPTRTEVLWEVPSSQRHRGRVGRAKLADRCAREHVRAFAVADRHPPTPSTHPHYFCNPRCRCVGGM
eukprot:9502426-Pyramimonas_sp.AAC.1